MLKLRINCSERSSAREFADKVSDMLSANSLFTVTAKIANVDRNVYKITWWYNDNKSARMFAAEVKDEMALAEDDFEYDVSGLAITNRDKAKAKENVQPDAVMKQWEASGKFKFFCAMYGLQPTKPLHLSKKREELTGSNARAWERATGEKLISDNFIHFITGYFEQAVSQYQINDQDWNVKCIDTLLKYHKVFQNGKKVYISGEDLSADSPLRHAETIKKKNKFYIGSFREWQSSNLKPLENPDEVVADVKKLIGKYYPEILKSCDIRVDNGIVVITVN